MKIALINFNLAVQTGATRFTPSVARALGKLGHRVVVFTAVIKQEYFLRLWEGVELRVVHPKEPVIEEIGPNSLLARIRRRIRANRRSLDIARRMSDAMDDDFDVVCSMAEYSYRIGYFYKEKNPKSKFIWIMFDPPFRHRRKKNPLINVLSRTLALIERVYERKFYIKADYVAVLDEINQEIAKGLGLPVKIIRSGLDFESFYAPVKNIQGQKSFTLLSVGSLSHYRRFEDTIASGALLRKQGYDARVLLICKDLGGQKTYRQSLLDLVAREGVDDAVDFRFDGVFEEELRKLYRESDIFVFPNTERIWGMATFEAMASGLPAVVSSSTTVAEFLDDGKTALFSAPGKPEDIAVKVKSLIDDSVLYQRLAFAGQQFVKEQLSWEQYAENFLKLCASI